jgi:hypothetical protein
MIEIDPTRFRQPRPFTHQLEGVRALVRNPAFFLGDSPRTCKSRQVVDAACVLKEANLIDLVLVVCPVAGRAVWGDARLGQIKLYSWLPSEVLEFHARRRTLWADDGSRLTWVITNYDFVRTPSRLQETLLMLSGYKAPMLVLDESSAVGNHNSRQSKAVERIRQLCARCVMLNGTPGEPPKIWSQFNILDRKILSRYKTFTTFKWQYTAYARQGQLVPVRGKNGARGGMRMVHESVGWKNVNRLSRIVAPWCLRRERKDCPELRTIPIMRTSREVPLSASTWRMYKQLRREAIVELEGGELYLSPNAAVRLLRLSQMTSGQLGGFDDGGEQTRAISSEKIDSLVEHLDEWSSASSIIVWCRWTLERERLADALAAKSFDVYQLHGGQRRRDRREAEMIFSEGVARDGTKRYIMLAQPQAGGVALDMSAASEVYRLSNDYNLKTLEQSDDRPLGPGQRASTVVYTEVLATGPDGQRTIDHTVAAALAEKLSLSRLTTSAWRKVLVEEESDG